MSNDNSVKLSDQLTRRTAGSLPSSRTKDVILRKALESDNIDVVKGALMHTWLHYESLELALANYDDNAGTLSDLRNAITSGEIIDDVNDWDKVVVEGVLPAILDVAYDISHQAGAFASMFGTDIANALVEFGYPHLDYSDPERELSDEDLAKLSGQTDDAEDGEL